MYTIGDISRMNACRCPEKVAIRLADHALTYRDLDTLSNRLANRLRGQGVTHGDRVALLAFNCPEFALVAQAVAKLGAILVPVNVRLAAREMRDLIAHCTPRLLFAEGPFISEARIACAGLAAPPALVSLRASAPTGLPDLRELTQDGPDAFDAPPVDPKSCAAIMYTSGTTGRAKGVMISHEKYLRIFTAFGIEMEVREPDVVQLAVPLFHNGGFASVLGPALMVGASVVCHRGAFDPRAVLEDIARHRITLTHWVPTMLSILLPVVESGGLDLSSLRVVHYGAMPIAAELLARARRALPHVSFFQGYGTTDAGLIACLRPEHAGDHPRATGRPVFNTLSRIVDDAGRDVAEGEAGEVIVHADTSGMMGYWADPAATRAAIRDGWIHTGDIARRDQDGFFTLVERMNFLIISGGENIFPREVEDLLIAHPGIAEVAVFGVKDETFGEVVCAALVPASTVPPTLEELRAWCDGRLARYKLPRHMLMLPALPRTALGKIAKGELMELFRRQHAGITPDHAAPRADA
ncbi:class I adenylate-forming enzyme family protein [Xanthobacter agilis]|uniref:Acyl-CoA synthetase (AMP-forming)/AMP-acid ligase II n=1 Tax=Xanthobacter agilis TaxID=47492 RepID=A0ABU0L8Z6_XANAG|nr:AMP-binding protein [Xanthobacter agilis]MDQ0503619.1 acyl-CoA synthetase (AMP-forming)/AMP-acid ligase II [Xanthobacter agilis]